MTRCLVLIAGAYILSLFASNVSAAENTPSIFTEDKCMGSVKLPAVKPSPMPPPFPSNTGGPVNSGISYPLAGSYCSEKYKAKWEGTITEADTGQPAMQFFMSNPPGWGMARRFCVKQRPDLVTSSCDNFKVAYAPDGSVALEMYVPKGIKYSVGLTNRVLPANTYAACAAVDIWIPVAWQAPRPNPGMKWGLGLWGGGDARCASGGCSGSRQDGFTMRLEVGTNLNPRIYSYHLNRPGDFGKTSVSSQSLARGRWVTVEQELIMESPGSANGVENMYLNGVKVSTQTGLIFGRSRGWYIKGYNFNDLWGGNVEEHQSPVDQAYWYKNLKVYY